MLLKQFFLIFFVMLEKSFTQINNHRIRLPYIEADVELRANIEISKMQQRIDHFSFIDHRHFDWRYTESGQFFNGTGPMFVFIGGEANIEYSLGYLHKGLMYDIARQQGAYMYLTEHRYYGESIPYGSVLPINLLPLTVKQALQDLAEFIIDRKKANPGFTKVIVFGGSYAGSLAAWSRLKYPDLIYGAVSSSGTFNVVVNGFGYNEVVQKSLSPYPDCVPTIHDGIVETQNKLKTFSGMQQVRQDFNFTILPLTPFIQQMFFNSIIVTIGNIVQYDKQESSSNITQMCGNLTLNKDQFDAYTRLSNFIKNSTASEDTSTLDFKSAVSWLYQICTELGEFVTTDSENQPYSNTVPLSYWQRICFVFLGPLGIPLRTNMGVNNLAREYGGLNINVTRVIFTTGSIDPWSSSSLKQSPNSESPLLIIEGASHCADLLPATKVNSSSLFEARTKISNIINTWLH